MDPEIDRLLDDGCPHADERREFTQCVSCGYSFADPLVIDSGQGICTDCEWEAYSAEYDNPPADFDYPDW